MAGEPVTIRRLVRIRPLSALECCTFCNISTVNLGESGTLPDILM